MKFKRRVLQTGDSATAVMEAEVRVMSGFARYVHLICKNDGLAQQE